MSGSGRSIELFFHDGDPSGMVTATIPFQWTGHVLVTSRTQVKEALSEQEADQPGLYMLLGDTEDGAQLYVGETDRISARVRQHLADPKKDWFEAAIFVTATGEPLNKAHVRYLEHLVYQRAKAIGKVGLLNATPPVESPLSRAAKAHMDDFFDKLSLVLPALRYEFLLPDAAPMETNASESAPTDMVRFAFELQSYGIRATARLDTGTGKFTVEAGSQARREWVGKGASKHSGYADLHAELTARGVLVPDGKHSRFDRDYTFRSTSAAAAVVSGRSANGPVSWRLADSTKTYFDWEKEFLN